MKSIAILLALKGRYPPPQDVALYSKGAS